MTNNGKGSLDERKVLKVSDGADDFGTGMEFSGEEPMPADGADETPVNMDEPVDGEENPFDTNFDAGVEASEEDDPKKFIQQLAGKLSQSLRSYNSDLPSPDVDLNKYVAGMVTKQAVEGLSAKDANEILKKIQGDEDAETSETDIEDEPQTEQEPTEDDEITNESVIRDKINEIFQELTNPNGEEVQMDKPIGQVTTFSKKPFTAPHFK